MEWIWTGKKNVDMTQQPLQRCFRNVGDELGVERATLEFRGCIVRFNCSKNGKGYEVQASTGGRGKARLSCDRERDWSASNPYFPHQKEG